MIWANPAAFLLLIPWVAAVWALYRRGRRKAVTFAALGRVPRRSSWRQRLSAVSPALLLAGSLALVIAAARPQSLNARVRHSMEVVALQMVIDVSGSMEALDLSVRKATGWDFKTRLDVVKELFQAFVDRRPDDLIGLITFGGFATTRSPLTLDHEALKHLLEAVQIPRQEDGVTDREELMTAIGDGLAMGCARLEQVTNVASRVIVLLSDGESNAGIIEPRDATRLAKSLGIKVYCIGVGSTGMAPFRTRDMFGRETIAQAHVTMDEEALKEIAAETGGLYFSVHDRQGLDRALQDIDKLEKTRIDEFIHEDRRDHFGFWLVLGVCLTLTALTVNMAIERRLA